MSAQPCGCDSELDWTCQVHADEIAKKTRVAHVQRIDVLQAPATTEDLLRQKFPHGHKHYLPTALKQIQLHSTKNHDYASGGDPLGNFDRVAAILGNYPNLKLSDRRVVAMVYAMKQIDAVLWGINSGIQHKVEGLDSRLDDIAVYANIIQCMNSEEGQ